MEHVSLYRKTMRMLKGGRKRLEEANQKIDHANSLVDYRRERVQRQLRELHSMIPTLKIGG